MVKGGSGVLLLQPRASAGASPVCCQPACRLHAASFLTAPARLDLLY